MFTFEVYEEQKGIVLLLCRIIESMIANRFQKVRSEDREFNCDSMIWNEVGVCIYKGQKAATVGEEF